LGKKRGESCVVLSEEEALRVKLLKPRGNGGGEAKKGEGKFRKGEE